MPSNNSGRPKDPWDDGAVSGSAPIPGSETRNVIANTATPVLSTDSDMFIFLKGRPPELTPATGAQR